MKTFWALIFVTVFCWSNTADGLTHSLPGLEYASTPNPPTLCGETLTTETGTISSPNNPQKYPNWVDCTWTIIAPEGKRLALTFDFFQVENADNYPDCNLDDGDFVSVYDGAEAKYKNEIDHICGAKSTGLGGPPFTIASSSNSLTVQFIAGPFATAKGFSASYEYFECGGTFTAESGEFASPEKYMDWLDCEWIIKAQEGKSIKLTFDLYDVEKQDCDDYVTIYDFATNKSTIRCDNEQPLEIVSKGDLRVNYVTRPKKDLVRGQYNVPTLFQASYSSVDLVEQK